MLDVVSYCVQKSLSDVLVIEISTGFFRLCFPFGGLLDEQTTGELGRFSTGAQRQQQQQQQLY